MKDITILDLIITLFLLTGLVMIYQDRYGWGWVLLFGYLLSILSEKKTPPGSDTGK